MQMREKKTEVLTIRITKSTKSAIEQEAEKREWSISKMAEKILTAWASQQMGEKLQEHYIDIHENAINNINIL